MKTIGALLLVGTILAAAGVAWGQAEATTQPAAEAHGAAVEWGSIALAGKGIAIFGACVGAGLALVGGGIGIGLIGGRATEAIARQPEAAGQIFLAWLLPAAMIEGAMLFAVVLCFLVSQG